MMNNNLTLQQLSSPMNRALFHFFEIMNSIADMVKQCTVEVYGKEKEWKCNFLICLSRKVPK